MPMVFSHTAFQPPIPTQPQAGAPWGVGGVSGLPGPSDNVPTRELGHTGNKKALGFVFAPFSSNRDTD